MKSRVSRSFFVVYCPWKHFFDFYSPQTPSNLISLTVFVTLSIFGPCYPKIGAVK